jgi:hypothetical protein
MVDAAAAAKALVTAYNEKDFDTLEKLIAPNLDFAHFNRGIAFNNREPVFEIFKKTAFAGVPDRKLSIPERLTCSGNVAVVEHWWSGTPTKAFAEIPGHSDTPATMPEKLRVKLCSVFRFDDNGVLVEWKDHG